MLAQAAIDGMGVSITVLKVPSYGVLPCVEHTLQKCVGDKFVDPISSGVYVGQPLLLLGRKATEGSGRCRRKTTATGTRRAHLQAYL